jgi:acyl-CoA thioesterase
MLETLDKDTLAEYCAKALFRHDRASRALGISIVEMKAGRSKATMVVRDDMVNGLDICHGGIIFALADSAFAAACNSHNVVAYAMGCHIEYLRPAIKGDTLTARATEMALTRNTGSYVISITNQVGKTIGVFHGRSSNRGKPLITHADLEELMKEEND